MTFISYPNKQFKQINNIGVPWLKNHLFLYILCTLLLILIKTSNDWLAVDFYNEFFFINPFAYSEIELQF